MTREPELARLVALAHFKRAEDEARRTARTAASSQWIVRGLRGFHVVGVEPPIGERWRVEPTGQVTHVAGPVI